jgi:hypothetical protein
VEQYEQVKQIDELQPYPSIDPARPLEQRYRKGIERQRRQQSRGSQREGGERRQHDRRKQHVPVMLDTRSGQDRRLHNRRQTDVLAMETSPRRRGINVSI